MAKHKSSSPRDTMELGQRLAAELQGGEVVAFTGGMGSGKTTFCRGLAEGLGCVDPVSSPSFALVNLYRGPLPLAHFDAWRISGPEDLESAGFYDYRAQGAVVAVEWSEHIGERLDAPVITVDLRVLSDTEREITVKGAHHL